MNPEAEERRKYERMWDDDRYRKQSDGEPVAQYAFHLMGCEAGETLIDWGCGTGKATAHLRNMGLKVLGFDIAENCLDGDYLDIIPLVVGALWNPPDDLIADYAFCTDVLEHIPPRLVGKSLDAIAYHTRKAAYIQVDTVLDISGPAMKPPLVLHLTVQPQEWWLVQLKKRWESVRNCPGTYTREGFLCIGPRLKMPEAAA